MKSRKKSSLVATQFHTVKRIDNSRLVRNVQPVRLQSFYRTAGLGALIAAFLMMYIYQHFRCIDLSFQLEDLKAKESLSTQLNSELKLEIEGLRDPRRIDVIARRQLGLTQPMPTQVQEYDAPAGAEVAAAGYARANHD
ncbi:MAG: septum formation initiator family protein [Candidatus Acidiferrum sp.]|jgi:cell division protein FtsL